MNQQATATDGTGAESGQALNLVDTTDGMTAEKAAAVNADKLNQIDDDEITKAFKELDQIGDEREALNATKNAIVTRLVKLGLPRNAIGSAYSRYKTNDDKLAKFDAAYAKILNAVNKGYQPELFT